MEGTMLPFVDRVISISNTMTKRFCLAVGFPATKVTTIYVGVDERFTKVDETEAWEKTRQLYRMPPNFLLFVGHVFPNKNLENLLRSFKLIAGDIPHLLIVGGRRRKYRSADFLISELGLEHVSDLSASSRKPTWSSCTTLRAVSYSLRVLPVVWSCPTRDDGLRLPRGCFQRRRFAGDRGDAAVDCDPHDPANIGDANSQSRDGDALRQQYVARALQRAKMFTWDYCAQQTLALLETVGASRWTSGIPGVPASAQAQARCRAFAEAGGTISAPHGSSPPARSSPPRTRGQAPQAAQPARSAVPIRRPSSTTGAPAGMAEPPDAKAQINSTGGATHLESAVHCCRSATLSQCERSRPVSADGYVVGSARNAAPRHWTHFQPDLLSATQQAPRSAP